MWKKIWTKHPDKAPDFCREESQKKDSYWKRNKSGSSVGGSDIYQNTKYCQSLNAWIIKPLTSDNKIAKKKGNNETKWMGCSHKDCKGWRRDDWGGHNIAGHNEFVKNPTYGISAIQDVLNDEADTGGEFYTGPQDENIDWYIWWWMISMVSTYLNYMVVSVFIILAPNIIMIWFLLKREKWLYVSSNHLFNVTPVYQPNKKPIPWRDTGLKKGRLYFLPLALGNLDHTFAIRM